MQPWRAFVRKSSQHATEWSRNEAELEPVMHKSWSSHPQQFGKSPRGGWGRGWGYGRSPLPALLLIIAFFFVFSRVWWLIFLLPGLFFLFGGAKLSAWGSWNCASDSNDGEKRKNEARWLDADDDETVHLAKPKRGDEAASRDYEII
jgi:hypothetical protein